MISKGIIKVLHLNDKLAIRGGVEVYIDQLCQYGERFGIGNEWLAIYKNDKSFYVLKGIKTNAQQFSSLDSLVQQLKIFCKEQHIDIIYIDSISDPALIRELFEIRPVVRSMHEPRIVGPGQGKFWRKSERICTVPIGLHCLYHAYKEGCCNRHPKRLISQFHIGIIAGSPEFNSNMKIFDYAFTRCAVVAPNVDVLTVNFNKELMFFDGTSFDLSCKLKSIIKDNCLRKSLGINLYNKVKSKFTWDINFNKKANLINNILKEKAK